MVKKVAIVVLIVILLASCSYKPEKKAQDFQQPTETESFAMGTVIVQRVFGDNAQKAVDEVNMRIKGLENKMTINTPGGEINELNAMAGKGSIALSEDTFFVLKNALRYADLSGGAFDVTVGPLVKAWGVFTDNPRVPSQDEINTLLSLVDYKKITVDSETLHAGLENSGQIVDLGAIAKGYAGDEAVNIYRSYGIKSAYVNLGGNVVALGNKPDGSPWKIGVQNPRAESGRYLGILEVSDKAVVTSGDYERFFEADGKRYHHIIDPKTGYPADSGLISVTIVAERSIDADALSTAVFVLGPDEGMKLVEKIEGIEAVFVSGDKKVFTTEGLKSVFTFTDKSREFEYVEKR